MIPPNLYVTADELGRVNHGAGSVTRNEYDALCSLGNCDLFHRNDKTVAAASAVGSGPWGWDDACLRCAKKLADPPKIAHFYAGTFSKTIRYLRELGTKVTFTSAAHDINASRKAHEELGVPFDYPHLTNPVLWEQYVRGYLEADVLIVPSTHSKKVMESYGAKNRIEVIPHGVELPKVMLPPPNKFTVGYLGNCGAPDKGLRYLFEAWKNLNYTDSMLVIAGQDSTSGWIKDLILNYGGGNVHLKGWVDNVSDFYDDISLYVQPSVTEGFGIEIVEAMSHNRPVLASKGAGASDSVPPWFRFSVGDSTELARKIGEIRNRGGCIGSDENSSYPRWRDDALYYSWDKIREKYLQVWKELL